MDMAGLRTGSRAVSLRRRPVCRGAAPGHRRRRRDQRTHRRPAWRGGLVCRFGPDQRPDRHHRNDRRLFDHARPPRLDCRHARGSGCRRRASRGDRAFGYPRTRSSLRAHGRSDGLRPERLPRPACLPPPTCGGARERALVDAGEAAGAEGADGTAAAPGSCSRQCTDHRSRRRIGRVPGCPRDRRGRGAARRAARAGRGRCRRSRPDFVVRSRLRHDPCRFPGARPGSCRRRAPAPRGIPADRVDPVAAGTGRAPRTARRRAGPRHDADNVPGTPTIGDTGVEPSRRRHGGSRRGGSRPPLSLGGDRTHRSAAARRGAWSRGSAGLHRPKRGGAVDVSRRLPDSRALTRARGTRSCGLGGCDLAAPFEPAVIRPAGGPWGATYHLWRCASI
jgi:hypothetical protein